MFTSADSLKVRKKNTGSYVSLGQYITEVRYEYNKVYANGSGRTLSGVMVSDLLGTFPKIIVKFKPLTKTELEALVPILDSSRQQVQYYDPNKKASYIMETYTGNYTIIDDKIIKNNAKNKAFEISFIPVRKRA